MAVAAVPIRILIGKVGLDGHDRGVKLVARALRDAGMEVIYTGLHQTPEQVVSSAIQEDVDAIGLSIMSGAHNTLFPAVLDALAARGVTDVAVFGLTPMNGNSTKRSGGSVPVQTARVARPVLSIVDTSFQPGTSTKEITRTSAGKSISTRTVATSDSFGTRSV